MLSLWYSDSQLKHGSSVNSDHFDATDLRLETEREADIYLKTVYTLGDHLAPTMIITAMRKTDNR